MQNNNNNTDDISMYYPDGDAEHMEMDDHDTEFLAQNHKKKERIKKKNAKLTSAQITLIAVIFVVYTAIIFAAAWMIFYRPAQPGVEEVPFDTSTEANDPNNPPFDEDDPNTAVESGSDQQNAYIPKEGVYNILVVGHDVAAHLADVTMIVNCNEEAKTISIMQIPRDTLVSVGVVTNKTNAAFSTYYNQAYQDGAADPYARALEQYASLFEKGLCINIHHTVLMDLEGFRDIVNAMGGVDLYVPADMEYEDPEQDLYIHIKAGYQHLDGTLAEQFVRFREDYVQADLGRVNAQKIFLTAMFNKAKATVKSLDVSTLTRMAKEVSESIHTDLSVSDIMYYGKFLLNVDLSSINMMTLPGNVAKSYYVMNREATRSVINQYFNIYNTEISDGIFDKSKVFCLDEFDYVCDVYYGDAKTVLDDVYNAESIDEDSINIPILH